SLHSRLLANISRGDIADLLNKIVRDHGKATANRARSNLSSLFTWAQQQGKTESNPVSLTEKREEKSRDRVLENHELAAIWNALPQGDYGAIVRLLMLTGQRREEIGGLCWSEIAGGQINLPPNRTKNGKTHFVPLSEAALAQLPKRTERDHVFGRGDGTGGFAGWSAAKASLDQRLPGMKPWTLHDLRRTCATGMAKLGVNLPVIERALNHVSGSFAGIVGVYQHHDFNGERRGALAKWAAHIVALVGKPKPVAKAGATASPRPHKAAT